jgi:hypothetical protein
MPAKKRGAGKPDSSLDDLPALTPAGSVPYFFFELSPGARVTSASRAPLIPTHEFDVIG